MKHAREAYANLWWVRCLLATESDKLGLVLRAAMAKPTLDPPWLGPSAIIDREGIVLSNYVDRLGQRKPIVGFPVCGIDELLDNCRRLADQLALTQAQTEALFDMIRQWIKSDARPTSEQAEDRIPAELRN